MTIPDRSFSIDTRPTEWQKRAACQDCPDPDVFFPDRRSAKRKVILVQALYCNTCPVRQECFEYGQSEEHGLWGGVGRRARGPRKPKYDRATTCRYGHLREPGKRCPTCKAKSLRRYDDAQQQSVA